MIKYNYSMHRLHKYIQNILRFTSSVSSVTLIHIIVIFGLIAYSNSLFNNFVWDDKVFIINNPDFQNINILQLFENNLFNSGSFYRPIPAIYFGVLYYLFNSQPFFYHIFQISLHIINSCLLFILLKKLLNRAIAFFGSLLFLIHPNSS